MWEGGDRNCLKILYIAKFVVFYFIYWLIDKGSYYVAQAGVASNSHSACLSLSNTRIKIKHHYGQLDNFVILNSIAIPHSKGTATQTEAHLLGVC
jgi:hypothetical protein